MWERVLVYAVFSPPFLPFFLPCILPSFKVANICYWSVFKFYEFISIFFSLFAVSHFLCWAFITLISSYLCSSNNRTPPVKTHVMVKSSFSSLKKLSFSHSFIVLVKEELICPHMISFLLSHGVEINYLIATHERDLGCVWISFLFSSLSRCGCPVVFGGNCFREARDCWHSRLLVTAG